MILVDRVATKSMDSSVEASGFELKFSKALNSRKMSEKLFEASWLDISFPKQGRKGKEGKEEKERKERKQEGK